MKLDEVYAQTVPEDDLLYSWTTTLSLGQVYGKDEILISIDNLDKRTSQATKLVY